MAGPGMLRRLVRWLIWALIGLLVGATVLVALVEPGDLGAVLPVTLPAVGLLGGLLWLSRRRQAVDRNRATNPASAGDLIGQLQTSGSGGEGWRRVWLGLVWALIAFLLAAPALVALSNPTDAVKVALPSLIGVGALSGFLRVLRRRPTAPVVLVERDGIPAGAGGAAGSVEGNGSGESGGTVESRGPTVALRLGPAERAALEREKRRVWRLYRLVALASFGGLFLLGLLLGFGLGEPIGLAAALGLPGLVVALAVAACGWWVIRQLERDLAGGLFYRTTGPLWLVTGGKGVSATLELADRAFLIGLPIARKLEKLAWGTLDHTPRAHLLLEARDAQDQVVYRAKDYEPDG